MAAERQLTADGHSPEFRRELEKRRRDYDDACKELQAAQIALNQAETRVGSTSRSLDALEGCLR